MVFLGHYLGIYKYAESFFPPFRYIDYIQESSFSFIIDEGFWLHLFFVVSGYLVYKSKISDSKDLFTKIVSRFFRFLIPIFFVYIIIYAIYILIGFHSNETTFLFQCNWYQKLFYTDEYTVKDILLSPISTLILGNSQLNGPYWVLPMMFFSSSFIYLIKLIISIFNSKHKDEITFVSSTFLILLSSAVFPIFSAHLIGVLVSILDNKFIRNKKFYTSSICIIIVSTLFLPERLKQSFLFAIIILIVPHLRFVYKLLSNKLFQFFGNMCWGIFSFHWPIIYSIGALCIIFFSSKVGLSKAYIISLLIVFCITICLSLFFYLTLEKFAAFLTKVIRSKIQKLLIVK